LSTADLQDLLVFVQKQFAINIGIIASKLCELVLQYYHHICELTKESPTPESKQGRQLMSESIASQGHQPYHYFVSQQHYH
jgi:hypothetical protein